MLELVEIDRFKLVLEDLHNLFLGKFDKLERKI